MRSFTTRYGVALAAGVVGIAMLLSGCVSEAEEPAEPNIIEEAESDETTPEALTGAACLTGSWLLKNETFEEALKALVKNDPATPAAVKSSLNISLSGDSSIKFDGNGEYGAWQDAFAMNFDMGGESAQHVQDSADLASYEADDEYVWVTDFSQLYVNAEMRIGDAATVKLEGGNQTLGSVSFFGYTAEVPNVERELVDGAARYECTDDTLVLYADGGMSATFTRIANITRD